MKMDVQLGLSEKGKPLLIFENYKFREVILKSEDFRKWRCANKTCKAVLFTDKHTNEVIDTKYEHSHAGPTQLTRNLISNAVKRKAVEALNEVPREIIRLEINTTGKDGQKMTLKDVNRITKNVYQARRSLMPCIPKTLHDAHQAVDVMSTLSDTGDDMLLFNDRDRRIICFATRNNLEFLSSNDTYFVDGTFKYCPKLFKQVMTIHTKKKNEQFVPLVFLLLPDKKKETYIYAFSTLTEEAAKLHIHLQPTIALADFEEALQEGVQAVWSDVILIGCRFHVSQAWWRKIQALGLTTEYKEKGEVGKWLTWLFGLSLLDPQEATDCFFDEFMACMPDDDRIVSIVDYLHDTYMKVDARFPSSLWAAMKAEDRTSNACEAFHSTLKHYFRHPHPDVTSFVIGLQSIQHHAELCKTTADRQEHVTDNRIKKQQNIIKNNIEKYLTRDLTRFEYVKRVSYTYAQKS